MWSIAVEMLRLRDISGRSSSRSLAVSRDPWTIKQIHRYLISSWCCTPGNCGGHYALCLMVGLVEGLTRVSVVASAGIDRGRRNSKREALAIGMWSCTASDEFWYAIHEGRKLSEAHGI